MAEVRCDLTVVVSCCDFSFGGTCNDVLDEFAFGVQRAVWFGILVWFAWIGWLIAEEESGLLGGFLCLVLRDMQRRSRPTGACRLRGTRL